MRNIKLNQRPVRKEGRPEAAVEFAWVSTARETEPSGRNRPDHELAIPGRRYGGARLRGMRPGSVMARVIGTVLVTGLLVLWGVVGAWAQQMGWTLKDALEEHKAGNLPKAVELYGDYLKKNPRSAEAFNWRGMAYDDMGKLDQALADYDQAINLSPKYADAFNNRGEIYRQKKDYPNALKDFQSAAKLDNKFAEPLYNIGMVYEAQGHKDLAAKSYLDYLKAKVDAPDKGEVLKRIQALQGRPAGPPEAPASPPGAPKPAPPPGEIAKPAPGQPPPSPPPVKPPPPPQPPRAEMKPGPPAKPSPFAQPTPAPELPFGLDSIPEAGPWVALVLGMGIFAIALILVPYLIGALLLFLIARKVNVASPWMAFIPILNLFLLLNIARKPVWWFLLILAPYAIMWGLPLAGIGPDLMQAVSAAMGLVSLVIWVLIWIGVAQARQKAVIWGILAGIPCTAIIAVPYLALSK